VFDAGGAVAEYEPGDVHLPAVRRVVGAVRDAELALEAEIGEVAEIPWRQAVHLAVHLRAIERPEEDVEGGTQVVAAAAGVADVRDPAQLLVHGDRVVEIVRRWIEHLPPVSPQRRHGRLPSGV
jgi:hypothetical protein